MDIALPVATIAVGQAVRVPPLKDVEVAMLALPPAFDGYTILHLTDLQPPIPSFLGAGRCRASERSGGRT